MVSFYKIISHQSRYALLSLLTERLHFTYRLLVTDNDALHVIKFCFLTYLLLYIIP